MDSSEYLSKSEEIIGSQIQKSIEIIKTYINNYSLIPVLEKAFINDNFIYKKEDGTTNEDCKLCLYIGDLFLTYQKEKTLQLPNNEQVETVFNCFLELVQLSMTKEMIMNNSDLSSIDYKVQFKYTERSFYINIMSEIINHVIDEKWFSLFYSKTGFYLKDIFTFNFIYKGLLYDRFKQEKTSLFSLTFEELFSEFKNLDNSITETRLHTFIEYFSCKESSNTDYLPSVDNPLIHKPIIQTQDYIICCDSLILIKNSFFIIENELKKDEKLFSEYGNSKGEKFEKSVQSIFQKLFVDADFYSGLEYITPEDKKLREVDLLIDTGNYLLIVESKGRSFQENAKHGNDGSYNRSVNNVIKDAHEQCKITYNFLDTNDKVYFKKKDEKYEFSKKNYLDIYLITVELDNLDAITADIYKTLGVFEPNPIITFSLYDLVIIQDILEKGSIFLNYLEQRRGVIKEKKITSATELDYLSYYIHTGMFYDKQDEILKDDFTFITIGNFSNEFDEYYFCETNVKPHYPQLPESTLFFSQLRQCNNKLGFNIEKEVFKANLETQKNLFQKIEELKNQARIRGQSSIFSFVLETSKMGLSIICYNESNMIPNSNYFRNYIHDKQVNYSIQNWFFIVFSLVPYKVHTIIFER